MIFTLPNLNFLPYFFLSLFLSLVLTPVVRDYALKNNIVSKPGGRNINIQPIARLGGLAVFVSFWITILLVILFTPEKLHFVASQLHGIDRNLFGVILGALILLLIGVIDDVKGMNAGVKLIGHFLASLFVVFFGIKIMWIHNPITGLDSNLGSLTYFIVPVWIVLVINVINWLDGVDGLATGIGLIASVILFTLSLGKEVNQPATALLSIVLAGSLLGFLPYNFNPAKIF